MMGLTPRSLVVLVAVTVWCLWIPFDRTAQALDDGARAYWKTMADTNVVSFQYLKFNVDSTGSQVFDPSTGIYPNSETDLDLFVLTYGRQFSLFGQSAMITGSIYGGDINAEFDGDPFNPQSSTRFRQTANGFGDPSVQLVANLFGAPSLDNFYDMANYEPNLTVDVATLLTIPIGQYKNDKAVNIGQNRWYGRIALPVVAYFGSYAPLYRTSLEVTPSVWLYAKNDDYLGEELKNDPLYQLEAHLTHDLTRTFFASLDFVWRKGFDAEINGDDAGEKLDLKALGFTVDYVINDNASLRFSYQSNFLDNDELEADMLRIQFTYGWNELLENVKVLEHH
jgi:hypothetical protein